MAIRLSNPTGRSTEARVLELGEHELFFSYETLIAYRGPRCPRGVRVENSWGPTTGRHFRELGCAEFGMTPKADFEATVLRVLSGKEGA